MFDLKRLQYKQFIQYNETNLEKKILKKLSNKTLFKTYIKTMQKEKGNKIIHFFIKFSKNTKKILKINHHNKIPKKQKATN